MRERNTKSTIVFVLLTLSVVVATGQVYRPGTIHDVDLLEGGTFLITDGGNLDTHQGSGIFEIDRNGRVLWSYALGLVWAHNADRVPGGNVIISDTGNDRVIVINRNGAVIWNSDNVSLSDGSSFDYPNDANLLENGNRLITDRNNHRVVEIDEEGTVVWQFGETGVPGNDSRHLDGPHNADRLSGGNTIIADSNNGRIVEITPRGAIAWTFEGGLDWPRDADRLRNGNTLINDSRNGRIIEVTQGGAIVWEYQVDSMSYDSDRLQGGHTLIGTQQAILEVDQAGNTIWSFPSGYETEVIEGYLVTAPNGNRLWTKIIQPRAELYPEETFPAVVDVSGGLNPGEGGALYVARDGFVEFHFNAEGRGMAHPSEGQEDHNGFIHQDDLNAIIEFAHSRSNVTQNNLGVITHSYGITMGAGCLGRYPDLRVKYFIDVEGPSESFVTCKEPWALDDDPSNDQHEFIYSMFGHYSTYRDSSAENMAWWGEREATRFMGDIRCRYLRIQAEWDHAQPPNGQWPGFDYPPLWYQNKHAIDPVNLATEGVSPWTRVNGFPLGNPPNTTYSRENPPVYYDQRWVEHQEELRFIIHEMAAMNPLPVSADYLTPVPLAPVLCTCLPNPFRLSTTLKYSITEQGQVTLGAYDLMGRSVRRFAGGWQSPGDYDIEWDGRDDSGARMPSGHYFIRLRLSDGKGTETTMTEKVLLVR